MLDNPESFKVHAQNYVHAANVVLFFDCSQHFARKENVTEIKVMMLFKNEMDSFFFIRLRNAVNRKKKSKSDDYWVCPVFVCF